MIFINFHMLEMQGGFDNQELKLCKSNDSTIILSKCNNKSFNKFWSQFRKATINKDTLILKDMVSFPIEVKLPLDENPQLEIDKANFIEYYNEFLSQISGLSKSNHNETMIEYIDRTPNIWVEHLNRHDTICVQNKARIGSLIFQYDKKWMLKTVYFNYETSKKTFDK